MLTGVIRSSLATEHTARRFVVKYQRIRIRSNKAIKLLSKHHQVNSIVLDEMRPGYKLEGIWLECSYHVPRLRYVG